MDRKCVRFVLVLLCLGSCAKEKARDTVTAGADGQAAGGAGGAGAMGRGGSTGAVDLGVPADVGVVADPYAQARQDCVDKINAYRQTEGKPPYQRWTAAEACTDAEAKSDSQTNKAHGAFGQCQESAQNECPNWGRDVRKIITDCLQGMWNEGPGEPFAAHGHYLNMASTKYTRVACGFHLTAAGKLWAIQNFK